MGRNTTPPPPPSLLLCSVEACWWLVLLLSDTQEKKHRYKTIWTESTLLREENGKELYRLQYIWMESLYRVKRKTSDIWEAPWEAWLVFEVFVTPSDSNLSLVLMDCSYGARFLFDSQWLNHIITWIKLETYVWLFVCLFCPWIRKMTCQMGQLLILKLIKRPTFVGMCKCAIRVQYMCIWI